MGEVFLEIAPQLAVMRKYATIQVLYPKCVPVLLNFDYRVENVIGQAQPLVNKDGSIQLVGACINKELKYSAGFHFKLDNGTPTFELVSVSLIP